jgi:putative tricarboxylic transport membrane protein
MTENSGDGTQTEGKARRLLDGVDLFLAAAIIAGCAYLYYVTTTFEEPSLLLGQNVLPSDFPQSLLITISLLALLLPIEHRMEPTRWPKIQQSRGETVQAITWATMGLLVATVTAAPYLGTHLTIFLASLLLPLLWGERRLIAVGLFAVIFSAAVAYVFESILKVHFEPGVIVGTFL